MEREMEQERARARRGARVGVGSPAFEALTHWREAVWPKVSGAACPEFTAAQVQSLAVLSGKHGPPAICAAMDAALADEFWGPKLDLDTFIAKYARWLERKAPAPRSNPQVGVAAPAPAAAFGEGGRRAIE